MRLATQVHRRQSPPTREASLLKSLTVLGHVTGRGQVSGTQERLDLSKSCQRGNAEWPAACT